MARRTPRLTATQQVILRPSQQTCESCGGALWVAHHKRRTVTTLQGVYDLRLVVHQCQNKGCQKYHKRYRPEEEGSWALPHAEFGLDVIALVGRLRFREHRSRKEIHQELLQHGVQIAERTVAHLIERYEELVTIHVTDRERIQEILNKQGKAILCRAICAELSGLKVTLKEIEKARSERRKQVRAGLSTREALVKQLLDVHHEPMPPPKTLETEPAPVEARPRLKRYIND